MKRVALVSHLEKQGCFFVREGARHSVFYNPKTNRSSTLPRHSEIVSFMAKKICRDLDIIDPPNKGK